MRRLWYNGTVASMDGAMRRYEAVGAEDGRLTFWGAFRRLWRRRGMRRGICREAWCCPASPIPTCTCSTTP
ncbi:hypothetical protein M5E87_15610 [Flavonifractor plautii]|nr:hypothetical protein M5E87_15610 [Flavonifractor plautii]